MQLGQQRGTLTTWKDNRGFGFITPNTGGQDIFVHISDFKGLTRRPRVGDKVGYDVRTQDGKLRAHNAFMVSANTAGLPQPQLRLWSSRRFPWEVVPLAALPFLGSLYWAWINQNPIFVVLYPVMSGLTFIAYANDKLRAQTHRWRIPERTLHGLELLGGWPGAFIAQRKLRHKSKKPSYQATFWGIVGLHYAAWISCLLLYWLN